MALIEALARVFSYLVSSDYALVGPTTRTTFIDHARRKKGFVKLHPPAFFLYVPLTVPTFKCDQIRRIFLIWAFFECHLGLFVGPKLGHFRSHWRPAPGQNWAI